MTLQPPGPNRGGHHTYPSLSRDGALVATSYVKSPYPHYREGIATYSLIDKQWKQYSGGDFDYVWAITISPDGSTLAFKAERRPDPLRPSWQLLLLNEAAMDETPRASIHQFDLGPRKLQKKAGKSVAVLGWSRSF